VGAEPSRRADSTLDNRSYVNPGRVRGYRRRGPLPCGREKAPLAPLKLISISAENTDDELRQGTTAPRGGGRARRSAPRGSGCDRLRRRFGALRASERRSSVVEPERRRSARGSCAKSQTAQGPPTAQQTRSRDLAAGRHHHRVLAGARVLVRGRACERTGALRTPPYRLALLRDGRVDGGRRNRPRRAPLPHRLHRAAGPPARRTGAPGVTGAIAVAASRSHFSGAGGRMGLGGATSRYMA